MKVRTSLMLPPMLYQRLVLASRAERKTPAALIRELLDKALRQQEEKRLCHMYTTLKELDGIGEPHIRDASTTIDELLYGTSETAG